MARVLIVEDDCRLALSMRLRLEAAGHEVLHAEDGMRGLEMALEEPLDLILLDLSLPRLSGIDVARRLSAGEPEMGPRIVLVSGSEPCDHPSAADVIEGHDWLRKPYTAQELTGCVQRALARAS